MINSTVKILPKSTAELEITIPWNEIKSVYDKVFEQSANELEISGFRKGKAPKDLVEKNINKSKIYELVIKDIIPKVYSEAIQLHKLTPVTSPKIEIAKAKENEDWQLKITIALKPTINLKNYKEKIRELKKSNVKIWTPGKKVQKEEKNKTTLDDLVSIILSEVEIEFSDLLTTQEVNRLLADLIDQTKKLGLTVDQYLMAKGKTIDQLRQEYAEQAAKNLTLEFALAEIADKENISVAQQEIDALIAKAGKSEEREKLKQESYYLAHLLRQQKTLDFLNNL